MSYRNVKIEKSARIAKQSIILGDVTIGRDSCVLYYAVIRGDDAPVTIGAETNIQENCTIHVSHNMPVHIGNNVTIGENVGIYTSNHAKDPKLRRDHWCSELPIRIGNNVVIESNSVVLPGTIIGDDAWIRPGSVVLGRIEADSICAGDPARRESK